MRRIFVLAVSLQLFACGADEETAPAPEVFGPTDTCYDAIACAAVADPENAELFERAYGLGAECWNDAADALACVRACEAEQQVLLAADPTAVECWEGDTPNAAAYFALRPAWDFEPGGDCRDRDIDFRATHAGPEFTLIIDACGACYPGSTTCTLNADSTFVCEPVTDVYNDVTTVSGSFSAGLSSANVSCICTSSGELISECTYTGSPIGS